MKKTLIAFGIFLVIALGILYFSFYSYYQEHFFLGTTINETDVGGKTAEKAETLLVSDVDDYVLKIREGTATEFITASKLNLKKTLDTDLSELLKDQGALGWLFKIMDTHAYTVGTTVSYSESALRAAMEGLSCMNPDTIVDPVNAYIAIVDGSYVIVADEPGNEVDEDVLYETLKNAVDNLEEEVDLEAANIYKQAEITADNEDLLAELAAIKQYEGIQITLTFGDETEVIDAETILSWMEESEAEDGTVTMTVSEDAVATYVAELARTRNTFGTGLPRSFVCNDGKTRSIYGGDYGWWMNQSETAAAIIAAIESGEGGEVEPVWRQTAYSFGDNDYGNSYCEVNITQQKVWVVIDGEVMLETDCVTGKVSTGHDTPTGCYGIRFMRTNYTLVGQDYNTKVSYWMPFYDDVGFHDATWRSSFGGTIYKTNGSHGCVNLPYSAAAQMYELVYTGMPVFVYEE
ncbi:MAG: L,D-transpeptidase/peptidoglycan binding protein [Lachnospiraceae bacterium]|nr:L,D-transpeptidase/peptidoglycan binding protein [Lachnospiraceae bacterium]